ncbi:MBL fold metallo-hydrolase [Chelativorans salis]|uniref:MBL fold metallo-hydrolase n=1 Tax=Chelativorans salis TaxID=2978478 RepID=A0ABT2LVC0_9HYPH|nr:MBL fold metallo-hydrolase [Chelativorans sp. EGI FJ00035]MCT7378331.1 MBL fold metallo-hydrolase [Chelativorans sp. EGI FJ00035]
MLKPLAPVSRRRFLAGAAGFGALGLLPEGLHAAPAPHRFRHGDFEVTVISDGYLTAPSFFQATNVPPEEREAFFSEHGISLDELRSEANITLIRADDDLILFDTGSGKGFQPTAGAINDSLAAAGFDPADITKVVFTHGHPDHIWGTILPDGGLRFPNAAYYSAADEWDFWNGEAVFTHFPSEMHDLAREAQRQYAAVRNAVTMVKPGDDIVTGIHVLSTPGHTPGHVSFEVEGGDGLIVVADAIVHPVIYFAHPDWQFAFDAAPDVAAETRRTLLDRAATDKVKLLGFHWDYPGVGFAKRRGNGYTFMAEG